MRGAVVMVAAALTATSVGVPAQGVWQADLQVRTLSVSEASGRLGVRVVVATELGEATAVRLEILLPVGVGVKEMTPGCIAGPSPPGVSDLRGRVICRLGDLPSRSTRALEVVATAPPPGVPRGFGAVALSDTPDPHPENNFGSKTLP